MVRRSAGVRNRVRFDSKAVLLAAGAEANALRYQRASQDKKEQGKSVGDQGKLNLAEVNRYGWRDAGSFTDNDLSASRHAKKDRPQFELLVEAIRAGKGDVLVMWEISRKEGDLAVYVKIGDMCTEVGLYFWLVGGVLYDLRDKNDRMMLGFQAVQAEWMADSIRDNVLRGIVGAAEAGRPHGKVTYVVTTPAAAAIPLCQLRRWSHPGRCPQPTCPARRPGVEARHRPPAGPSRLGTRRPSGHRPSTAPPDAPRHAARPSDRLLRGPPYGGGP